LERPTAFCRLAPRLIALALPMKDRGLITVNLIEKIHHSEQFYK
jgi:hypothetical protein